MTASIIAELTEFSSQVLPFQSGGTISRERLAGRSVIFCKGRTAREPRAIEGQVAAQSNLNHRLKSLCHSHEIRHMRVDKFWQHRRLRLRGLIQSHHLRLPAQGRIAGTSIANVTDVALKKLRGGRGNGGSAGHRKTERSDRQSNNKPKGMRQRGLRHPLWCFRA